jgi:G3E family GTPase
MCCVLPVPRAVRGDLIRTVNKLLKRRNQFDAIIIETTGLANPAPVIQVCTHQPYHGHQVSTHSQSSSLLFDAPDPAACIIKLA